MSSEERDIKPDTQQEGTSFDPVTPKKPKGDKISLTVMNHRGESITVNMKPNSTFEKLMNTVSTRWGINSSTVRFMANGQRIWPNQTPDELELEDEDTIDVVLEQQGGGH